MNFAVLRSNVIIFQRIRVSSHILYNNVDRFCWRMLFLVIHEIKSDVMVFSD